MTDKKVRLKIYGASGEEPVEEKGICYQNGDAYVLEFGTQAEKTVITFSGRRAEITKTGQVDYRIFVEEGMEHPFNLNIAEGGMDGTVEGILVEYMVGLSRGIFRIIYNLKTCGEIFQKADIRMDAYFS